MSLDKSWFTEKCEECGSAFSLRIRRRLHEEHTPFQHIAIYETETYGNLMTIDGFVMLTTRDNFLYHEMMSHPALFTHRNPKNIVIIGGGDCGTLREVLKHRTVESVVQVELDERVTRLSEAYFPELCESNADPRARLEFTDGIQWVAGAPGESLDVVIVDSTDPVGQAARLFSEPFYSACRRALRPGGILAAQSESPLIHAGLINTMRANMRDAGFTDVGTLHFPQSCYPSGWWTATLAGRNAAVSRFRETDAAAKGFPTQFYTRESHLGALAIPPFLERVLT